MRQERIEASERFRNSAISLRNRTESDGTDHASKKRHQTGFQPIFGCRKMIETPLGIRDQIRYRRTKKISRKKK